MASHKRKFTDGFNIPFPETKKPNLESCSSTTRDRQDKQEKPDKEKSRVSRSTTSPIDWSKCFICENKTYKKVKEFINVCTFEASTSIKKGTEIKGDEYMLHTLRSINDDLIAAGARYHKNCFALYVSKTTLQGGRESESHYEIAFQELAEEICSGLNQGKAYEMGGLPSRYSEILKDKRVQGDSYSAERLKASLQKHFGESIVFHQQVDRTKPEISTLLKSTFRMFLMPTGRISKKQRQKKMTKKQKRQRILLAWPVTLKVTLKIAKALQRGRLM